MLAATLLGIFFIPVFYLSVRRWLSKTRPPSPGEARHHDDPESGHA
jgi:multidrug efflux pump